MEMSKAMDGRMDWEGDGGVQVVRTISVAGVDQGHDPKSKDDIPEVQTVSSDRSMGTKTKVIHGSCGGRKVKGVRPRDIGPGHPVQSSWKASNFQFTGKKKP